MTSTSAIRLRPAGVAGVVGPTAFVTAWVLGAFLNDRDLSAVDDAISQLAHVDTNTRWLMTSGFVIFAGGVGWFATGIDALLGRSTAVALGVTAASTLAVAALPLGTSDTIDRLHGLAAGIGYISLALAPVAAQRPLRRLGRHRLAIFGGAASVTAAVALAISLSAAPTGALQRLGLTMVDAWIVALAAMFATRRLPSHRPARRPVSERTAGLR